MIFLGNLFNPLPTLTARRAVRNVVGMVPVGHVPGSPPQTVRWLSLVSPGPPKGSHTKVLSREAP